MQTLCNGYILCGSYLICLQKNRFFLRFFAHFCHIWPQIYSHAIQRFYYTHTMTGVANGAMDCCYDHSYTHWTETQKGQSLHFTVCTEVLLYANVFPKISFFHFFPSDLAQLERLYLLIKFDSTKA